MQLPPVDKSTIYDSGIIRADYNPNVPQGQQDVGYMNYMANLTPEQNLMRYERNPNVKQVVVFDASTGQAIPNIPVYDQMIMLHHSINGGDIMEDFVRPAFSERAKIVQEKLSNSGKYIAYCDGPIVRLYIKQECNNDTQDSLKEK